MYCRTLYVEYIIHKRTFFSLLGYFQEFLIRVSISISPEEESKQQVLANELFDGGKKVYWVNVPADVTCS